MDCQSKYCINYDSSRWFCNCRIADSRGSAAFINECRANRKFMADQNKTNVDKIKNENG